MITRPVWLTLAFSEIHVKYNLLDYIFLSFNLLKNKNAQEIYLFVWEFFINKKYSIPRNRKLNVEIVIIFIKVVR